MINLDFATSDYIVYGQRITKMLVRDLHPNTLAVLIEQCKRDWHKLNGRIDGVRWSINDKKEVVDFEELGCHFRVSYAAWVEITGKLMAHLTEKANAKSNS